MVSESAAIRPVISDRLRDALNAARAAAAIYVVLHHATKPFQHSYPLPGAIFRFGQEAVIIFFLLSGFVIFANEQHRARDIAGYAKRRFLRIYPPLIIAILLSTLVMLDNGTLARYFSREELFGTLASLQDLAETKPGVIVSPYLRNLPLWSLSYEVAFYALFPLALYLWSKYPRETNHGVGLLSCISFLIFLAAPNHWALVLSYFSMWWTGAMCADAHFRGKRSLKEIGVSFGWLAGLSAISVIATVIIGFDGFGYYPAVMARHFVFSLFALMIVYAPSGRMLANVASHFAGASAFLAAISYGLYVFHYPLLVQWHRAATPAGMASAILILILLSYAADARLHQWLQKRRRHVPRSAELPADVSRT